ncbi:MAG: hypothetical protein M1825_001713 [Sarcosagium campestre]|nr:MAG: hypothetical protein M1825_001713 [Sarcosagium campestre]
MSTPKLGNGIHRPDTCRHYNKLGDVPWDIQKQIFRYWHQRNTIFSKYDEGVWLTDDAWFGVTPEPVALKIAHHLSVHAPADHDILVDAFAGAGGNTIAFALSGRWRRIIAIEKDADVLECAKQNARVYGVYDKIEWIQGDCFRDLDPLLEGLKERCTIFASPPWGGPTYRSANVFDLSTMEPYSLKTLYEGLSQTSTALALYLPRTSDLRQIAEIVTGEDKINVIHYCVGGASKAICAFFGALSQDA